MVPSRPPLRILHTESSIGWGGQEIRILTEARGMLERGHQVALLAPRSAEIFAAAREMGVPVHDVAILKKRVRDLASLYRWCRANVAAFDIVNTHSSTDSWLAAVVARITPGFPPIVRTRHVSTAVGKGLATRWLYGRATAHVVTTGEALRQQLHRDIGMPLEHMSSVPTGIDLDRFAPRDRKVLRARLGVAERPTIGIVATLRDWKGHDYLLDAFAELRRSHPAWQLLIVGDGPRRGHLERRAAAAGLGDDVRFVGNRKNVEEWFATFDVFALPSFGDEGVPQGIMQAMACRLPVVSTPVGAIAEALVDEVTGLMVPPRDASAIATALARLLLDDTLRDRLGEAGLRRARERFGLAPMLDAMETIFRRCAAAR